MTASSAIHMEIAVPSQTRYLGLVGNMAEQVVQSLEEFSGDREALAYHLNLVLTEAMTNAIEHGGPPGRPTRVRICLWVEDNNLLIRVYDQGTGFDLSALPAPDFEDLPERGRGIFIIRALMDHVDYHKTQDGNVLEMQKKLS